jgi:hypothetical protein
MAEIKKKYLFIDESGDPNFYARRKKLLVGSSGFQPFLLMGLLETDDRVAIRKKVLNFMDEIRKDPLYNTIASLNDPKGWYVHARSDHPEIRAKFFELLREMDGFRSSVVIAHKNLEIFNKKHNNNPKEFYFDVIHRLLASRLNDSKCHYQIYLSRRGTNSIKDFKEAIDKTIDLDFRHRENPGIHCNLQILEGREMPEFSVIDYMIWAVQRELLKNEARYREALKEKYGTIFQIF